MASFRSVLALLLPLMMASSTIAESTAPCHDETFRAPCSEDDGCMAPATGTITGTVMIGPEDPALMSSLNSVRSSYGLPALSAPP